MEKETTVLEEEIKKLKSLKREAMVITSQIGELEVMKSARMNRLNDVKDDYDALRINAMIGKYGDDFEIEI